MSFDPQAASLAAFNKAATLPSPDAKFLGDISSQFPNPGSLFTNPTASAMSNLNSALTMPATVTPDALSGAFANLDPTDTASAAAATAASSAYATQQAAFVALQSKANDFTTVMNHVTTATYPPNLQIPTSLGGVTGSTLPNISQIMSTIQGEHALSQQMGTTSPTNACSSLLGTIGNLGSGVSSSINSLLGTGGHAANVSAAAGAMSSATNGIVSAAQTASADVAAAAAAVKTATGAALAQAQATLATATAAAQSAAKSAISTLNSAVSSAQSAAADGLAAIHGAIDSAMSSVNSMAASVESSISNQIHMATATMMRNLTESSPCMANFFQNSGLVPSQLNSLISSSPSASAAAATAHAPNASPSPLSGNMASDAPQPTASQGQALQTALDTVTSAVTQQLTTCNAAVDSFNAWYASVNYQAVKNAQNDSADALAAYQALKAQGSARPDYLTQQFLSIAIKANQSVMQQIKNYLNFVTNPVAASVVDWPADGKLLYKETQTLKGVTVDNYALWSVAKTSNSVGTVTFFPV